LTETAAEFETLVAPWVAEMYRLAAAFVGADGAEDVAQDALLDAWRGWARLRDRTRVRPWLHAIVVNRARKHIRAQRSRPRLIAVRPPDWSDRRGSESDASLRVEDRDRLDRAFEGLTAEQRACVVLHYSFDISVPQIASTLALPEGTVKSRIHAGIRRLRAALDEGER
jgi:RNA polymerase sigma-70 factor (ECF subfamily)